MTIHLPDGSLTPSGTYFVTVQDEDMTCIPIGEYVGSEIPEILVGYARWTSRHKYDDIPCVPYQYRVWSRQDNGFGWDRLRAAIPADWPADSDSNEIEYALFGVDRGLAARYADNGQDPKGWQRS